MYLSRVLRIFERSSYDSVSVAFVSASKSRSPAAIPSHDSARRSIQSWMELSVITSLGHAPEVPRPMALE